MAVQALITLGSNIDKERNLPAAVAALRHWPGLRVVAVSPTYSTRAIGSDGLPSGRADFHNAAVLIETTLDPAPLRGALRQIERALGRVRTADKFAPRPIDLDLVFYGEAVLDLEEGSIPDPDVERFAHLALPLADVAPDWVHPLSGLSLRQIAQRLAHDTIEVVTQ